MTPEELKALQDEQAKVHNEFKAYADKSEAEIKRLGTELPETKAALAKLNERLDAIETKMNRPAMPEHKTDGAPSEGKAAFEAMCRKGDVTPEQRKALAVTPDTAGGYLAPAEYVTEIIKGAVQFSPIRALARVRTTSSKSTQFPKRTGTPTATWVAEAGAKDETGMTYGLEEIPNHELAAKVIISNQDLEDAAFNMEAEITADASEQFGVAEGAAFVSGTGVGKPKGFLAYALTSVKSGSNTALTADGLIDLVHDLPSTYARNAAFVLHRAIVGAIRKLKDPVTGLYMWQPAISMGAPATILGYPYAEAVDMVSTIAQNGFPIAFGDWRSAYLIVDRLQVSVLRDPYSLSDNGQVKFVLRKRVGGQVVLTEALRLQKVSA